jgi:Ca2+-binding RTX toxin-like protein
MATPHVAGAIALYSSLSGQSAADISANLLASTAATSSLSGKTVTGGRLDVPTFLSKVGTVPPPVETVNEIYGTTSSDTITGTTGADKIWGVPATGTHTGRNTIDTLTGNGGADTFVLGDGRGRFYDDGRGSRSGTGDYAVIKDLGTDDKIQLKGAAVEYIQKAITLNGVSGMGIYHDSNGNGAFDSRDELIGIVEGATQPIEPTQFVFV